MNKFKDKTILITGGVGFIGSNLCDELLKYEPKKIILFDNISQSSLINIKHLFGNRKVKFVEGNIKSKKIKRYILKSDFLFHLAATDIGNSEINGKLAIETNIKGTFNLLEICRKNPNIRVVYASSGSVIGNTMKSTNESTPPKPESFYAISKMAGEKYVEFFAKKYGIKVTIARYYHVYGPRQRMNGTSGVVNIFLSRILKNELPCIWGDGSQEKLFTYVQDVVRGTILLAENDKTIGKIYNIVDDNRISIKNLAYTLIKKYAKVKMIPTYGKLRTGELMCPNPSNHKIKNLGWKGRSFSKGLELTKQWVEENL